MSDQALEYFHTTVHLHCPDRDVRHLTVSYLDEKQRTAENPVSVIVRDPSLILTGLAWSAAVSQSSTRQSELPILHHEHAVHRRRVEALRAELAEAFDTHMALTFEILPALRVRYEEIFASWSARCSHVRWSAAGRRRMVELFALKRDRGEKLDARMVELV